MAPGWKLLAGIAATALLAKGAWYFDKQSLQTRLARPIVPVMLAEGVTDAAVRWDNDAGWTWRIARLSGTADAATRARVIAAVRRQPGIADAEWLDR
ncbi:hypothetical protein [Novosphingobium sp. PASSN1]|uniref:hypothetical protein n=1 Tax=Novosphingobium sp. PASSN1 TaxID=2015561 RepID=UPI000BC66DB2|nr:hypothetical protein [Novosphingobium sp. PASSN1]OYU34232.1 MAG: hypothetical protein CFE35_16615 [Novosphingobium sp. PASSN1]